MAKSTRQAGDDRLDLNNVKPSAKLDCCCSSIAICSQNCVQIWKGKDRKTVFCRVRHKKCRAKVVYTKSVRVRVRVRVKCGCGCGAGENGSAGAVRVKM